MLLSFERNRLGESHCTSKLLQSTRLVSLFHLEADLNIAVAVGRQVFSEGISHTTSLNKTVDIVLLSLLHGVLEAEPCGCDFLEVVENNVEGELLTKLQKARDKNAAHKKEMADDLEKATSEFYEKLSAQQKAQQAASAALNENIATEKAAAAAAVDAAHKKFDSKIIMLTDQVAAHAETATISAVLALPPRESWSIRVSLELR